MNFEINVKDTKAFYSVCALALCAFVFVLCVFIITSMELPLGSDAYFHLKLSQLYGQGNFTGAFNFVQQVNQQPFYPPLYHFMILPVSMSGDPYTGLRLLEMIFLPLTFAATAWVMWKLVSPKAALITGLVMLGSWSFMDGAIQARPESLDLLLFPLIVYAAVKAKKKWFSALSIITVYNHGFAALTNVIGIALNRFKQKSWRKTLIAATIIIIPIILLSLYYMEGSMKQWATYTPTENPQEALFWTYPPWIPFYAGITLLGIIFCFKKGKTELETVLKWSILGNLVMLPFWADRWLQYSSMPWAMLVGTAISRWHGKKLYVALAVIAIGAWIYISFFLMISVNGGWWQPGRFIFNMDGTK
jgi:hypothetical protein